MGHMNWTFAAVAAIVLISAVVDYSVRAQAASDPNLYCAQSNLIVGGAPNGAVLTVDRRCASGFGWRKP